MYEQGTSTAFTDVYYRQVDTVYRICYSFMKNVPETEDMVQETILRLISSGKQFENQRHEKAWLIVTASNLCKDSLKRWWRREESLEDQGEHLGTYSMEDNPVLDAILALPKDQMYYYVHEKDGQKYIVAAGSCRAGGYPG